MGFLSLACTCEEKIKDINKARSASEKYAGFAIQFWAECYGKTQKQLDALVGRNQSKDCTGDNFYTGCHDVNEECVGHAFTDFVYRLTPLSGKYICIFEKKWLTFILN